MRDNRSSRIKVVSIWGKQIRLALDKSLYINWRDAKSVALRLDCFPETFRTQVSELSMEYPIPSLRDWPLREIEYGEIHNHRAAA